MGGVAIVLFSDLVDSTALLATLGDDRMDLVRRTHVEDVTGAVTAAGGRVIKTLGDGVMSSFDSGLGALRAAAQIQASVEELNAANGEIGIAARVGVAAGEPISDGDDLHGMSVVIASRLSSAAQTGEVLVQDLVQALVASRDGVALDGTREYELKGVPEPVRASTLRWRELVPVPADYDDPPAKEDNVRRPAEMRLPSILAAYADEPLIGRDREIAMLREATAPGLNRRAVVILGEPGIGKTRHAAAAAADAHGKGAVVALARCPPEAVIAFEPWVRAIGELALAGDDAWRRRLAEAAGPELAALVPELGDYTILADKATAESVVAAEGARYRLLRGIGSALSCAAGDAPLLVVLDDAQWCDPASAEALKHLLERDSAEQLVLVVTAREHEMGRRHPVSRVLSDLRRTGGLSELHLEGLDADGMAALVGSKVGRAITPGLAARLQARTSGNPFFAGELARDLDELGALREGEALDAAPVPDAVTGMVEDRLARLDPGTERLLGAVAAIGPTAPVALAAKAVGFDEQEAEQAVQEALSERLVNDVVAAEPTIAFPHALIREALIAGTSDAAHARLHLAIARVLEEDPTAEPAELARHYWLSVGLAGPEPAIAAHRAAANVAAEAHDHEQAAALLQRALSLLPDDDLAARASVLLELGEQELLSADLGRARKAFRGAVEAAREIGDAGTLALAALGFSGGDVGFGWEVGIDDPATVALLREGLEALGDSDPRLTLRMNFRLAYLSVYSDDDEELSAMASRAAKLAEQLGDAEAHVLAKFTELATRFARYPDPPRVLDLFQESLKLVGLAEECGREDLLFRVVQWAAGSYYILGRIPECDAAIERSREIAQRLGSPRFTWEVDVYRGSRMLDRGEREAGEELIRRGGAIVRRLRPDIHISIELVELTLASWIYDAESTKARIAFEAMDAVAPRGWSKACASGAAAMDGDLETARERMWDLLGEDLEPLRRPDGHLPAAVAMLVYTAVEAGDREAGERLRVLSEPLRPYIVQAAPAVAFGVVAELLFGRLSNLADQPEAAIEELRKALSRADACEIVWAAAWARVDLALALFRIDELAEAEKVLVEGEEMAARYGVGLVVKYAVQVRAEMNGRELPGNVKTPSQRSRPIRALTSRGGRRALVAAAGGLDDADLEHRFVEPSRQRTLVKALARGFQPAYADGFSGIVAYELEPYAIEPPPDAPWRWAIEVDSKAGRARLLEPAPLNAAVTIHIGLADWVRVVAGLQDPLPVMVAGRCSVEGDVLLAVRLEAMFGGR
jgi:class 3 adenylate cyclase/tetratricopeptide (TPR) repeat protein